MRKLATLFRALRALQPDSADAEKGLERLCFGHCIKMRESFRAQQKDQVIEFAREVLAGSIRDDSRRGLRSI